MGAKNVTAIKIMSAGAVAFVSLNAFCFVYYNLPVHITSKTGTTDYAWEKYAYFSKMTEGFGHGYMNNEGFNNLEDYTTQPIDILLMGSSHMEGTNVPQNKTSAAFLNQLYKGSRYAYNIGTSGHTFPHILNNIETAIQYYGPQKYVIIEINSIQFDMRDLEKSINANLERIPSYDSKIMYYLQKIPYLRLLYLQYKNFTKSNEDDVLENSIVVSDQEKYTAILDTAMKKLSQISTDYGITICLFYHPHFTLNPDGSISENTNHEYLKSFENLSYKNDILFINMASIFVEEYKNTYVLPHGFSNTAIGAGHLNETGHRLVAQELFRYINEIEKDGTKQ
jgi:hypothetical protein